MTDPQFLWSGWEPILRVLLVGTLGFAWIVLLLRGAGPRTLAKMTPFDFVITVTLGSAFGRALTAKDVSLAELVVVFALLVGLQWIFAAARARWSGFGRVVDTGPTLLFHHGEPVEHALRRHRFTESDLHSAARENGMGSLDEAAAIVLQSDGTFAVIGHATMGDGTSVSRFT